MHLQRKWNPSLQLLKRKYLIILNMHKGAQLRYVGTLKLPRGSTWSDNFFQITLLVVFTPQAAPLPLRSEYYRSRPSKHDLLAHARKFQLNLFCKYHITSEIFHFAAIDCNRGNNQWSQIPIFTLITFVQCRGYFLDSLSRQQHSSFKWTWPAHLVSPVLLIQQAHGFPTMAFYAQYVVSPREPGHFQCSKSF